MWWLRKRSGDARGRSGFCGEAVAMVNWSSGARGVRRNRRSSENDGLGWRWGGILGGFEGLEECR